MNYETLNSRPKLRFPASMLGSVTTKIVSSLPSSAYTIEPAAKAAAISPAISAPGASGEI